MYWLARFLVVFVGLIHGSFLCPPGNTFKEACMKALTPLQQPERQYRPRLTRSNLDSPILGISRKMDIIRERNLYRSVGIDGASGSGKSSGPGETLQRSCWEKRPHQHAALVLSAKPDTRANALQIANAAGRDDVTVVSPTSGHYFDFVNYAMKHALPDAGIEDALFELNTAIEVINRSDGLKGSDEFFVNAAKVAIRSCMTVCKAAQGYVDMVIVRRMIQSLPPNFEAVGRPDQYESLNQLAIALKKKGSHEDIQLEMAAEYLTVEVPNLSTETRSSIQATATTKMAPLFNSPVFEFLLQRKGTEITPEMILEEGRIVILDFPPIVHRNEAKAIGVVFKQALQKAALRRLDDYPGRENEMIPVGLWLDECQNWLTDFDIEALERGRASRTYHVMTYQGLPSLENGYGGGDVGRSKAEALLLNLNNRFILAQTCWKTREANAKLFGQYEIYVKSVSTSENATKGGVNRGHSVNVSEHLKYIVPERAFIGLRKGEGGVVEAIYFAGGDKFNENGRHYLKLRFLQNSWGTRMEWLREKRPQAISFVGYVSVRFVLKAFRRRGWQEGMKVLDHWWKFWSDYAGMIYENGGKTPNA
jgi:hypothetical protein